MILSLTMFSGTDKPECARYTAIADSTRHRSYHNSQRPICDRNLVQGWYRFVIGRRMNTQCTLHTYACGTDHPGWLNGQHPSVEEGRVTRRVCFGYTSSNCCTYQTYIQVRNCGSFYVYRLTQPPYCNLRYCTQ